MATKAAPTKPHLTPANNSTTDINETLLQRQSSEIVIALCGPIGCGTKDVASSIERILITQGYQVEHIRISSLMSNRIESDDALKKLRANLPAPGSTDQFDRYSSLQATGSQIRKEISTSVLAKLVIEDIKVRRKELTKEETPAKTPAERRIVYIVDQLKHPDEAKLLRKVYGSIFYLVGILSKEADRLLKLERENLIETSKAHTLIDRDKDEYIKFGQKLEKTLELADYFIRNKSDNTQAINKALERFLNLIHGKNGITPTKDESGMYAAFSASLESACLSRQVGAAICNEKGYILSTGTNDVPASGGGLYREDHENDLRCIHKGAKCYNDEYKKRLQGQIKSVLADSGKLDDVASNQLAKDIAENTQIDSLIEYSRAIHAEMDAIIAMSRNPSSSTQNAILFTTTYPCHNCARHIVAAGISRVVYVEPYEKSLAEKLHDDAITSNNEANKVSFEPFEGVAPRKYQLFFLSTKARKKDGKAIQDNTRISKNRDEEFIDSYLDLELGVIKHLDQEIQAAQNVQIIHSDHES